MTTTMTQQPFAHSPLAATLGMAMASLMFQPTAWAQSAPAPAASEAVSDRVKKDAAGPLYWIRLNAQKADAAAKPAPRITEVRAERPAPRPAAPPPAAVASTQVPPNGGGASVASNGPAAPASAGTVASGSAPDGGQGRELATLLPNASAAPAGAGAGGGSAATGAAGAGLVAPSGPSAAEAARAAAEPADEPDDHPLALVKAEEPEFPAHVMRKLRKGTVQVRFEVQADGTVANASIVQTSHRSLNEAAIEAVNGWRFQPVRSPRSAVVDLGFDLDS
jgi:TonB family protein